MAWFCLCLSFAQISYIYSQKDGNRSLIIGTKDVFFGKWLQVPFGKAQLEKQGKLSRHSTALAKSSTGTPWKVMFSSLSGFYRHFVNGEPPYTCCHNRTRVNIGGVQSSIPVSTSFNKVWQADITFNVHSVSSCKLSEVLPDLISTKWI